jgi:excinuclease ABC subunit A
MVLIYGAVLIRNGDSLELPDHIEVRGARMHNLKNIDVDIPLNKVVGIAGVSGSGKSTLALGILYAEGSRRYLEALSTYTRRRMTQAARAEVDEVRYVPAALALHQRPSVPGIRSTFGTSTELLNSLRLMFSRLANHRCPNGHYLEPSIDFAAMIDIYCPVCGAKVTPPSAEELAFNSSGACRNCDGTGVAYEVDETTLVPDETKTIDEGAVAPWQTLMWSLMKDIARDMGVRTDVPFRDLTEKEREIVFHGPAEKRHLLYYNEKSGNAGEMDFTYYSAVYTVENALSKVKDEKGMKRVERFLKMSPCPCCKGTRLSEEARAPLLRDISLDKACEMTLTDLEEWVRGVPGSLPSEMRNMADSICESFHDTSRRLMDLGLGYLTLDRPTSTLSTGERQRTQLARSVRNRTTGVLYVLDEPSIGLHPSNIEGLIGVMDDLVGDGNSIVLVDHDTQVLRRSDWIIELGPKAGQEGGSVITEGTVEDLESDKKSIIGLFLAGNPVTLRPRSSQEELFSLGEITMDTGEIHTVKPLHVRIPKGRFTAVTGVSGSGKTTMVLDSLIPALEASLADRPLPSHVTSVSAEGIRSVKLIDATPIGINIRSTVATYANVHDELRKVFSRTDAAKEMGVKAGDLSYNTGSLRCPTCDGTGSISLDVQFLPDVDIPCPDCGGSRYAPDAFRITRVREDGVKQSLPELMELSVDEALEACSDLRLVKNRLQLLHDVGLGYLTLGEDTPGLSGGEAQRLKLASEMGREQSDTLFVFDEPTIGLHPLDVKTLMGVFQNLIDMGATLIVIEHDLDVIRNADFIVDMGPGGGDEGGTIVKAGTPEEIMGCQQSVTGKYLKNRSIR